MRNLLTDAQISYHLAVGAAARRSQHSIRVTAEFLGMRMALLEGDAGKLWTIIKRQKDSLRKTKQYILLGTLDMCQGMDLLPLGHTEEVPAWIADGAPASMVMYPGCAHAADHLYTIPPGAGQIHGSNRPKRSCRCAV